MFELVRQVLDYEPQSRIFATSVHWLCYCARSKCNWKLLGFCFRWRLVAEALPKFDGSPHISNFSSERLVLSYTASLRSVTACVQEDLVLPLSCRQVQLAITAMGEDAAEPNNNKVI